jgi:hypothetical protein
VLPLVVHQNIYWGGGARVLPLVVHQNNFTSFLTVTVTGVNAARARSSISCLATRGCPNPVLLLLC